MIAGADPLVCAECGNTSATEWVLTFHEGSRTEVCRACDDEIRSPEPKHKHEFRRDIADWWCVECDTVTDYCQQLNPGSEAP